MNAIETVGRMQSTKRARDVPQIGAFVLLSTMTVMGFVTAGGARDDILSLLLWRPITSFALALAIVWSGKIAWRNGRVLVIYAGLVVGLTLLHTLPLPPAIWTKLPGREILVGLYRDMGMTLPWQPLSLAQSRTWNALFSLAGPCAALLLAFSLDVRQHTRFLRVIILLGGVSGLLGLMQAIGPVHGPLYFYRITNFGDGVGLFSNRNHQALFMAIMFPLLSAHLSLWSGRPDRLVFQRVLVAAAAVFLVPLLLVTGSRAGVILGVVGLMMAWWIYSPPIAKGRRMEQAPVQRVVQIGIIAAVSLGMLSLVTLAARATALGRLLHFDSSAELRVQAFPAIWKATLDFFPIGSGIGSFVETYQMYEPDALLAPEYLNHAHNDYLEILLSAGLPGALLGLAGLAMVGLAVVRLARSRIPSGEGPLRAQLILARAGLSALILLALSSASDYPLRVPTLMLLAAVCAVWVVNGYRVRAASQIGPSQHSAAGDAPPSSG
jgi:O-antigen ligase